MEQPFSLDFLFVFLRLAGYHIVNSIYVFWLKPSSFRLLQPRAEAAPLAPLETFMSLSQLSQLSILLTFNSLTLQL